MRKLMLAFASFWVKICLKVCKSTEMSELRELIKLMVERLAELEKVERGMITSSKKTSSVEMATIAIKQYIDKKAYSLSSTDWLEILRCDITLEEALLMRIVRECVNLHYYYSDSKSEETQLEVANALYENPNVTAKVMAELEKSDYASVVAVGRMWMKEHEELQL